MTARRYQKGTARQRAEQVARARDCGVRLGRPGLSCTLLRGYRRVSQRHPVTLGIAGICAALVILATGAVWKLRALESASPAQTEPWPCGIIVDDVTSIAPSQVTFYRPSAGSTECLYSWQQGTGTTAYIDLAPHGSSRQGIPADCRKQDDLPFPAAYCASQGPRGFLWFIVGGYLWSCEEASSASPATALRDEKAVAWVLGMNYKPPLG